MFTRRPFPFLWGGPAGHETSIHRRPRGGGAVAQLLTAHACTYPNRPLTFLSPVSFPVGDVLVWEHSGVPRVSSESPGRISGQMPRSVVGKGKTGSRDGKSPYLPCGVGPATLGPLSASGRLLLLPVASPCRPPRQSSLWSGGCRAVCSGVRSEATWRPCP